MLTREEHKQLLSDVDLAFCTLSGQARYEADCKLRPNYHDGTPRKRWEQLGAVEQWSWKRP